MPTTKRFQKSKTGRHPLSRNKSNDSWALLITLLNSAHISPQPPPPSLNSLVRITSTGLKPAKPPSKTQRNSQIQLPSSVPSITNPETQYSWYLTPQSSVLVHGSVRDPPSTPPAPQHSTPENSTQHKPTTLRTIKNSSPLSMESAASAISFWGHPSQSSQIMNPYNISSPRKPSPADKLVGKKNSLPSTTLSPINQAKLITLQMLYHAFTKTLSIQLRLMISSLMTKIQPATPRQPENKPTPLTNWTAHTGPQSLLEDTKTTLS